MELVELIKSRRSIGALDEKDVPDEVVKELLDIAVWAPNHKKQNHGNSGSLKGKAGLNSVKKWHVLPRKNQQV